MGRLYTILSAAIFWVALASTSAAAQQSPGAPPAPAASQPPATPEQLAAITQRGRALQDYDQAAWHGTDAAQAIAGKDTAGLAVFIARKTPAGWFVDFGALDAAGTTFLTVLEAQSSDGQHFTAQRFTPPRSDTGFLVAATHAIKNTEAQFKPVAGFRYNAAVIPNDAGMLYVYFYPAQSDPKIFPIGGDERFTVSTDGMTILEAHRMHNSVIAQPMDSGVPPGAHTVGGFHTVVVANVPQDTDVFHVLARTPPMPDTIVAQGETYLIDTDGTIKYLGPVSSH